VLAKNLLTERFAFYELDGFYSANPAGSQREAADAAEGVNHPQGHCSSGRDQACSHTSSCQVSGVSRMRSGSTMAHIASRRTTLGQRRDWHIYGRQGSIPA
jgi:hypothetical protein